MEVETRNRNTALGHPCCGVFRCTDDLENNHHRFCQKHDSQHGICAVVDCNEPVQERTVGPRLKACSKAEHQKMERLNFEKGKAAFTLTERLQKRGASYSTNVHSRKNLHITQCVTIPCLYLHFISSLLAIRFLFSSNPLWHFYY